jgi:hypothetical protein
MGVIRPTSPTEAIARARSMIDGAIHYQLNPHNGGRDPNAPDPATHWVDDANHPIATCDCAGFVAWALGFARYQPHDFPPWDGWINTDSMIFESDHGAQWFRKLDQPEAACLVVYPSYDSDAGHVPGHVGLVVDPTAGALRVIHCSHGNDRNFGHAIHETDDTPWRLPARHARYLRYLRGA